MRSLGARKTDGCTQRVLYSIRTAAKALVINSIGMFYKSQRRNSYLGYISALEYETKWYLIKRPLLLDHNSFPPYHRLCRTTTLPADSSAEVRRPVARHAEP